MFSLRDFMAKNCPSADPNNVGDQRRVAKQLRHLGYQPITSRHSGTHRRYWVAPGERSDRKAIADEVSKATQSTQSG